MYISKYETFYFIFIPVLKPAICKKNWKVKVIKRNLASFISYAIESN